MPCRSALSEHILFEEGRRLAYLAGRLCCGTTASVIQAVVGVVFGNLNMLRAYGILLLATTTVMLGCAAGPARPARSADTKDVENRRSKIEALVESGREKLKRSEIDAAEADAREAMRLAIDRGHDALAARAHMLLGHIATAKHELAAAREHYSAAVSIRRRELGERDVATADAYSELGLAWIRLQDPAAAKLAFERALAIRLEVSGEDDVETAEAYANLAMALEGLDDFDAALAANERALKVRLEHFGPESEVSARTQGNMALVFVRQGRNAQALEMFQHVLKIQRKTGDKKNERRTLMNIGSVYSQMGNRKKAIAWYQQALDLKLDAAPDSSPDVASAYFNIGLARFELKDWQGATGDLLIALEIAQKCYGPKHGEVWKVRQVLRDICVAGHKPACLGK